MNATRTCLTKPPLGITRYHQSRIVCSSQPQATTIGYADISTKCVPGKSTRIGVTMRHLSPLSSRLPLSKRKMPLLPRRKAIAHFRLESPFDESVVLMGSFNDEVLEERFSDASSSYVWVISTSSYVVFFLCFRTGGAGLR